MHPGELYSTHFIAQNLTGRALVAQAVPSIAPGTAARHFRKTECFCFTPQAFKPHEERELTVALHRRRRRFPADIETLSLAYTFYDRPRNRRIRRS